MSCRWDEGWAVAPWQDLLEPRLGDQLSQVASGKVAFGELLRQLRNFKALKLKRTPRAFKTKSWARRPGARPKGKSQNGSKQHSGQTL